MSTETLQAIDPDLSLELAGGNQELADDLLAMLVAELPALRQNIQDAFATGDMEQLRHHAHKMNGSTRYCGVPALQATAAALETAARTGDAPAIAKTMEGVDAEVTRLLRVSAAPM